MNSLAIIGGIIGVIVDIPLVIGILRGKVKQNFVTFFLWGVLDVIAFITIYLQNGNFWLPLGYTVGSLIVAMFLLFKRQVIWTWVETLVIFLVIICLIIWWQIGNNAATIASVVALSVASIPQIIATIKDPKTTPTGIYMVFSIASFLSFIGGESWTVEDKLYAGSALCLSVLIMTLSMRKN